MEIGSSEWKTAIVEGARKSGIDVQPDQADQFAVHALILKEWNQKINLTAIDSPLDMAVKHFLDSILPTRYIKPGRMLLDAGSGAGFPGIPLKVMIPSLRVVLVDAARKKVSFLKHVIQRLHLRDIEAVHTRLEALEQEWGGRFDVIVCRAFSSLVSFAEKSLPLLAPDGLLMAFKGRDLETDLGQASTTQSAGKTFLFLGNDPNRQLQVEFVRFELPFLNLSRTIVTLTRRRQIPMEIEVQGNIDPAAGRSQPAG